jgi:hypothetical protein
VPSLVTVDADIDFGCVDLSAFLGQEEVEVFSVAAGDQVEP